MKKLIALCCAAILAVASNATYAATSHVIWENVDHYRDIRAVSGSNKHFKARLFKALEQHISQLASALPESYSLEVKMTDVDLAGNVQLINTQQVRVIKEVFMPRISLSYKLADSAGKVLQEGDADLKDMNFLDKLGNRVKRDSFIYEKNLLTYWYNTTFL